VTYDRSIIFSGYSPTHKTDRQDITKILLKVSLNMITLTQVEKFSHFMALRKKFVQ